MDYNPNCESIIVLTGGYWKRLFGYLLLLVCFGSSFIDL